MPFELTHKQNIESQKHDAYTSPYDNINEINFNDAWNEAITNDTGLPDIPPEETFSERELVLTRAITGLARKIAELRFEWS